MEIFIKEFRTTNELLLKTQSNLLSELKIEVNELSKVVSNVLIPKNEVKGVTTRGGKMTSEATHSKKINETGINKNEPPRFEQDVQEKPHDDGVENKSSSIRERTTQPLVKPQQSSIHFPNQVRKEKEEALQRNFLENLKQLDINIPFIEALVQIPKYAKYLKSLLTNKSRLEEACIENKYERWLNSLSFLKTEIPSKEKDPRSFTTPCQVFEKPKEAEALAANHLSRFQKPHMEVLTEMEIADKFFDKHLMVLKSKFNNDEPCQLNFWENLMHLNCALENYNEKMCWPGSENPQNSGTCQCGRYWWSSSAIVYRKRRFMCPNGSIEAQALPMNDARVVVKFLRQLFARFGVPKALISDRGTHFCNSQLEKALQRYGVTHKLSTAYHPQSNGQTEVTNRAIKRILERSVGYNPKGWSKKLNDALWAFRTAYKTPTGCTPFRLVYAKACHLPVEIMHKAHWALKKCNMDLTLASKSRLMQHNELAELRDGAYENTRIYKERTKKWHDSRLCGDKDFKVGDQVLLYNSRMKMYPGKLKSKWSGPNIIKTAYPHGAIEITDKDGFSFKVNGQLLKKYYGSKIDKDDNEVIEFENGVT
ncbi:reverse transcriptase domain-containing protein [Tanacetum coccineum]